MDYAGSPLSLSHQTLQPTISNRKAMQQYDSTSGTVNEMVVSTMVEAAQLKKLPFLKRNISKRQETSKSCWKDVIGTENIISLDRTNFRRQYRIHCVKHVKSKSLKKGTIMTSFLHPAYQCPICHLHDGVDFENLWLHCTSIHSDHYNFQPIQTTNLEHHLLIEECPGLVSPNLRLDKSDVLFRRRLSPQSANSAESFPTFQKTLRKRISLPVRTYYHNATFHPISLTEWLCGSMNAPDYKSEREWRRVVDTSALYDLTDVTDKEKLFMAVWNQYMRNNPILASAQLPSQLTSFVKLHSSLIYNHQIEDELIKHITNLWVEGHIGREDMLDKINIYNSLVENKYGCNNLRQS